MEQAAAAAHKRPPVAAEKTILYRHTGANVTLAQHLSMHWEKGAPLTSLPAAAGHLLNAGPWRHAVGVQRAEASFSLNAVPP